MAYLELIDIHKSYGTVPAVQEMNLEVERGEFVSFLGPSGCGKSTTLRMIAGLELPTAGRIRLNGADVTRLPTNKRNVGLVFQNYALFPNMTVADNVGFGLMIARNSKREIRERVDEMLAIIKMASFGARFPHELSGGQQQRVALARALAIRPSILLLDEPLSALDAKIRVDLRAEIRSIQRRLGITTIYVTHDQEEALALSDRIVVMREGHVDQIGTPLEIYNRPSTTFVASFVGTLNRVDAEVRQPARGVLSVDGQEVSTAEPLPAALAGQKVTLGLRPENLVYDPDTAPSIALTNRLAGHVENVAFLGSIVRVQMRVDRNTLFFDAFNHADRRLPRVGERVVVGFTKEACLILDGSPTNKDSTRSADVLQLESH
jgi:putative spermidine/putrescine transport system ATP-binding protein